MDAPITVSLAQGQLQIALAVYLEHTFILLPLLFVVLLVLLGFSRIILLNLVRAVRHLAKIALATLLFALLAIQDIFSNKAIVFKAVQQDITQSEANVYPVIVAVLNVFQLHFAPAA